MVISNEIISLAIPLLGLLIILFASTQGRIWLVAALCFINYIAYSTNGINFSAWGITLNMAVIVYMPTFLATDLLAERYGLKAARQAIYILISVFIALPIATYIATIATPEDYSSNYYDAFQVVFDNSWRISLAAIATIFFAQYFDVWLYDYIHKKTGDKLLWLRNCGSTFLSSLLDTVIFWTIAFYGVFPNIVELAFTAWVIKLAISMMDTPFIYVAKRFTPKDLKNAD